MEFVIDGPPHVHKGTGVELSHTNMGTNAYAIPTHRHELNNTYIHTKILLCTGCGDALPVIPVQKYQSQGYPRL